MAYFIRQLGFEMFRIVMEDGLIELSSGQYVVADPFFAQFLRTT